MPEVDIDYDMPIIAQSKQMSCWAAASAMLKSWKDSRPYSEAEVAEAAGPEFGLYFANDDGLRGEDIASLAAALGLSTEPPQNWTPSGYSQLLRTYGPLWVGCALSVQGYFYRHVRLLTGLLGDGTFEGTLAWVVDPASGAKSQESLLDFASEVEQIARQDLPAGSDLNPQVIHWP